MSSAATASPTPDTATTIDFDAALRVIRSLAERDVRVVGLDPGTGHRMFGLYGKLSLRHEFEEGDGGHVFHVNHDGGWSGSDFQIQDDAVLNPADHDPAGCEVYPSGEVVIHTDHVEYSISLFG